MRLLPDCLRLLVIGDARILAELSLRWQAQRLRPSGTLLFRAGHSIEVSRHDRRGVRLDTGDEIYLGRAALKVEIALTIVPP
jgi:hypothetical protein